jgi:glycosyltransferase involved in cell wall biosynthesis
MIVALLTTDNREHDKDYFLPQPRFGTAPAALLQGFAKLPEVEVHVVSCAQQPMKSPERLAPNIFYHCLVVPKLGWLRTFYQGCIRATRKKLSQINPDIVHGQGTERDCAVSAVFSGFPNVLTIHGNMRSVARARRARPFSFNWLAARLESFTVPRTDGVVCITNYTRAAVTGLARRTWLLPNAVDESFFDVSPAPDLTAPPVGLCVGAICGYKNQNAFIRALDPLARVQPLKIIFLGQTEDGAYGREFLELVRTRPWCEFAGFADRQTLKQHLRAAAFLALPTLEDNCPMVVLEAMAAGVPVVASNVGGVPDLIEPGVTGLLCDPHRPENFQAAVARLLADRQLSSRLAEAARIAARQRFLPEVIARRHIEIYREVLNRS